MIWKVVLCGRSRPTLLTVEAPSSIAALRATPIPDDTVAAWIWSDRRFAGIWLITEAGAVRLIGSVVRENPRRPKSDYDKFRTGLTYQDVLKMLWVDSDDPTRWRYKRRSTVLGLWRSIKLEMWNYYQNQPDVPAVLVSEEPIDPDDYSDDDVPF